MLLILLGQIQELVDVENPQVREADLLRLHLLAEDGVHPLDGVAAGEGDVEELSGLLGFEEGDQVLGGEET